MSFKIYYDNGSVYEGGGLDGAKQAPKFGIQVIAQETDGVGTELLHYFDYYLYFKNLEKWIGVYGIVPLVDQVVHCVDDIGAVGVGRMMHFNDFGRILKRAQDEADPRKSAKHKGEEPLG